MKNIHCNLCGSQESELLYALPDYQLEDFEKKYCYVRCKNCGLIYQNPQLSAEEVAPHYSNEYSCYQSPYKKQKKNWISQKSVEFGLNKRWDSVRQYVKSGTLLDVGCATGIFLSFMKDNARWNLEGLEMSPEAAQSARDEFNLKVVTGTLENADLPENFYDAITLWDVLEHLADPSLALQKIQRLLKPEGLLVFRVPNADSWDLKVFKEFWSGFEPPRHYYVYNQATLNRLLDKNGFKVKKFSSEYGSYMTFVLSFRFWMTSKQFSANTRRAIAKILYHPVVRMMMFPIFSLLSGGLKGPSITVAACKK
jgi:2-polyprenyl-3-methyl-5-hydroxy-6-metoxy-1,4-benzoquinol methylase